LAKARRRPVEALRRGDGEVARFDRVLGLAVIAAMKNLCDRNLAYLVRNIQELLDRLLRSLGAHGGLQCLDFIGGLLVVLIKQAPRDIELRIEGE
jgi:hypothetical protein